ncbi:MAG: amino acid--tRNA ligase-related protein [Patescibacteria group bacterium]|jgi:EF-P lysine aminoacylase GenX
MSDIKFKLLHRQQITQSLRSFLFQRGYLEADVPVLVPSLIPESYLEVFETSIKGPTINHQLSTDNYKAYLTASPEAYLKRLLVAGSGNVFYLGKAFRNGEPFGPMHNHEFTILEWYKIGASYRSLMAEIEEMVRSVLEGLTLTGLNPASLSSPWEYITMQEAFERFVPKDEIVKLLNGQIADNSNIALEQFNNSVEFDRLYVQYIEPNLGTRGKPTFVIDFPTWQSPLAKSRITNHESRNKRTDKHSIRDTRCEMRDVVAERFELYINGIELINGWTELADWKKQQDNFDAEQQERTVQNKTPYPADTGFIEALRKGMPECSGCAMGVDRLIMVLTGKKTLDEVIAFPTKDLFKTR